MNDKKLTPEEIAEQELADKIKPLLKEQFELLARRGNGVTLEKNSYIGARDKEIDEELSQLKKIKVNDKP